MSKEDIGYCGLDCELCKSRFSNIKEKIRILDVALEINIKEIAAAIPFMKSKYMGYKKTGSFF